VVRPDVVGRFLDQAHARGIRVIGWYLPGFADMERDLRRSVAVINFTSATGNRFDGFAPDIESRVELRSRVRAEHPDWTDPQVEEETRLRFNAGIAEYSRRLRETVGPIILGAIVVDAKNNERAPGRWQGFPWPAIAAHYDVVLPMAYWTASPSNGGCPGNDIDTASYMAEVASKTESLMGAKKPMHLIGGVADCISAAETAGYVSGAAGVGSLGVSLYDFRTTEAHPERDRLWGELGRFGG